MAEKTKRKQRGRPFQPGQSGNPKGRPQGALNKATLAAQALLEGEAQKLTRKAIDLALEGDTLALRLCLERLLPPCKGRPITIKLPRMQSGKDASQVVSTVIEAVGKGNITLGEGRALIDLVESFLRIHQLEEIEGRLTELERQTKWH